MGFAEWLADRAVELLSTGRFDFVYFGFGAIAVLVIGVMVGGWLKRRAAFRAFAQRHQLEFVGVITSDTRAPFIYFEHVRTAVLLYHVTQGRWEDFDVAIFDCPVRRATWTAAIVSLPRDVTPFRVDPASAVQASLVSLGAGVGGWSRVTPADPELGSSTIITAGDSDAAAAAIGPQTAALLAAHPGTTVETHFSYLRVTPRARIATDALPDLLRLSTGLARALMEDARATAG